MSQNQHIDIVKNYNNVLSNIEKSAKKAGRDPSEITLVGVTKRIEIERIIPVLKEGLKIIGEIVGKELKQKIDVLKQNNATIHVIGKLQSNKVKFAVEKCDLVQSVHNEKILSLINKRAKMNKKVFPIFLQIDFSNLEVRKGLNLEETKKIIRLINTKYNNVEIQGFMTIAPLQYMENKKILAKFFQKTREYVDNELAPMIEYDNLQLSMGMTDAYQLAIENGSTMVRVGTAIFGPRNK
ncbi:MAG: YggS family pyridoxal phosphate-dependent enzyme [Candidatus Heimdallarchaeum aukensis]|uniref:Pyridoxal phosphate homeostasis protein n=1 Tax=Candidatus Heimdallarchaeum aukensis TaxID=2876573 RepID=A0A9Y1BKE2_9ARCH|nr:MAG: YggS family pyridoxal phosphate-dependent enzyme [Candidatus Heimdallarchaeum aukensis]